MENTFKRKRMSKKGYQLLMGNYIFSVHYFPNGFQQLFRPLVGREKMLLQFKHNRFRMRTYTYIGLLTIVFSLTSPRLITYTSTPMSRGSPPENEIMSYL